MAGSEATGTEMAAGGGSFGSGQSFDPGPRADAGEGTGWEQPTIGGKDWQNNPDPVEESDPLALGRGVLPSEGRFPEGFRPTASPEAVSRVRASQFARGERVAHLGSGASSTAPFEVYIHVPFCYRRCGYCDFNTYTVRDFGEGTSRRNYADLVIAELRRLRVWQESAGIPSRPASSVYFGGGTPTILPSRDLVRMLEAVRQLWGLEPGAEVSTEANPDTVSEGSLRALADGGFTRVSLGMQSAVPHVLRTLDRTHRQENVVHAVGWAKECGLETSLDLIYGAPGESVDDWRRSLEAAAGLEPDGLSCYALTLAPATKMGRMVARGEIPAPSDDDEAEKYALADRFLREAGYRWYEISNWARPGRECRHNLGYWRGADWAGVGPGAHAHFGRLRTWDTRHPKVWARQLRAGILPWAGSEWVDDQGELEEALMLGLRLARGVDLADIDAVSRQATGKAVPTEVWRSFVDEGLLEWCGPERPDGASGGHRRLRPTLRGRLLNDALVECVLEAVS